MPEITCPSCGLQQGFDVMRRAAEEFCPHCDYPLFWAPSNVPVAVSSVGSDATLRRLPGAGGRRVTGTKICPVCGEHNTNLPETTHCIRCHSDLDPKPPEPEPEPEPVLMQIPPPPMAPKKRRRWWPWALLALGVVLTTVLVVWLVA